jgi:hypothetical protein
MSRSLSTDARLQIFSDRSVRFPAVGKNRLLKLSWRFSETHMCGATAGPRAIDLLAWFLTQVERPIRSYATL